MRVTRLKEDVLKEAVNLIQSLDPRPGQSIQTGEPEYVIPDVLVRKHNDRWVVELNGDSIPRLDTEPALRRHVQQRAQRR